MNKKLSKPPQIKSVTSQKKSTAGKLILPFFILSIIFITAYFLIPENEAYVIPRIKPAYDVFKKGMYDSSKVLIDQLKEDPIAQMNDSLYVLEADYYLKTRETSKAITALEQGISFTDSSSSAIYFKLGKLNLIENNVRNALDDFFSGLVLDPTNDSAWYFCGYIQAAQTNDYSNAIKSFEQALILNPEYKYSFNMLLWRGISFQELGDQQRAINQFKQAILLTTDNEIAQYYKAKSNFLSGDSTKACLAWNELNGKNFELAKLALDAYCN